MTNLFINSANARSITEDNSTITINLGNPVIVPEGSKCRVIKSTIWYDFPNIRGPNNIMEFTYNGFVYNIIIPDGLYSVTDLVETLNEKLDNLGIPHIFTLTPDESTGKTSLKVTYAPATFAMNFEVNNPIFRDLLGFQGVFAGASSTWVDSNVKSNLNQVNAVFVHCSFANSGWFNERGGSDIIHQILITESPGSQIVTEDFNPIKSFIHEKQIDTFIIRLTSEDGVTPIRTNEPWTLVIEIF